MSGLTISLQAYNVNPAFVFVRVPTERGRWILTDRCVVEVDCPLCGAITGEPCRRGHFRGYPREWAPRPLQHGIGVHVCRKARARNKRGGNAKAADPVKLRARAEDFASAMATPEAAELGEIADRIEGEATMIAASRGAAADQVVRLRVIASNLRALAGLDLAPVDIDVSVSPRGP